jgi:nucleotide-binding universal stress UspA family protein
MKILLAVDSSAASQETLSEIVARPWPSGSVFCVVNVVDLAAFSRFPVLLEQTKRAAETFVQSSAERLAGCGYQAASEVLVGFPRRAITEYARQWEADFVIVGSHGGNAVTRFLLGSVAHAVLRSAPCSVEVVRRSSSDSAASRGMKILLATDGSECSAFAAKSVASRPWPSGTQVKIVSVIQSLTPENQVSVAPLSSVYPQSLLEELLNDARARAHQAVASARKILGAAGLNIVPGESVPLGDPRQTLLDEAKDWSADLIVLGSHGWHGIDRLVMGSVSEFVALHAHCWVEVIRQ